MRQRVGATPSPVRSKKFPFVLPHPHTTASQIIARWPIGFMFAGLASVLFVLGMQLMHAGVNKTNRALTGEDKVRRQALDRLWSIGVISHICAAIFMPLH